MRPAAIEHLGCPACEASLVLEARETAPDGHVMEGALTCEGCAARYDVRRGVPRLVPESAVRASLETAARFAVEWRMFDHDGEYQEAWLRGWLSPVGPAELRGRVVLEGGCGMGRHTRIVAGWGAAAVVALDLGDVVDLAFARTRHLPNAHIVQGDLLSPPLARRFDVAFSVGVLHHLPEPAAGFDALRACVRAGGTVAIWVYGAESNGWITRLVNPVRERVTSRLPHRLLYWLTLPPSLALAAGLTLYRVPGLSLRLPYATYLRRLATVPAREVHAIVYDQLTPPIAHYLSGAEVRRWFARPGLADVRVEAHNANSWRGCATVVDGGAS